MKNITKKHKKQNLIIIFVLVALLTQACLQTTETQTDVPQSSPTLDETPTWTPSPEAPTVLPTATKTPISNPATASPVATRTPKKVTFAVTGGNLHVRRGPRLTYNFVGVLYDGDVAIAVGRDRYSRWLMVDVPSKPGTTGWVTTKTEYSTVDGDTSFLPLVEVDAPSPAFIRNCTKHTILVEPANIQLPNKYNDPLNIEHFDVITHQIYDLDANYARLEDVSLSEGRVVDITLDGDGDKSKCE